MDITKTRRLGMAGALGLALLIDIQASTGDSGIRVNIPYELDGKKGLYQCIADKQPDGSYKVTF